MNLYFNLDTLQLVRLPASAQPVPSIPFKRGDDTNLRLFAYRAGAPAEIDGLDELVFVIKQQPGAGPALALATEWVLDEGVYTSNLNLNTVELDELLGEQTSIRLFCELTYTDAAGGPNTSQTVRADVFNDLYRGGENSPTLLPDPDEWMSAALVLDDPPVDEVIGVRQTISFSFAGDYLVTAAGLAEIIITDSNLEDGLLLEVALAEDLDSAGIAAAFRSALQANSTVTGLYNVAGTGLTISIQKKTAAANDGTFAAVVEEGGSAITNFPGTISSTNAISGVAPVAGTVATRVGQLAVVSEADLYACLRVSPVKWTAKLN
jgi:hypothetical protein